MSETVRRSHLIWNKGIAALCDRRFPDEFLDGGNYASVPDLAGELFSSALPDNLIRTSLTQHDIRDGDLVWVRLSWLRSFVRQVLPSIDATFVLVTGDSDSCVPGELGAEARKVLESPKVIRWFTQNYDGSTATGRISPIPIGIDFHMLAEKAYWGENAACPAQQEEVLQSVRASLPLTKDRIQKVYVDFAWQRGFGLFHYRRYHPLHGTKFRESRRQIVQKMRKNESAFCQTRPLPRTEMWRERGRYAFVLSPHGMGLDCHRTWEALALGHVVIAPSSSLDPLFAGLPVVTLKSWDDITPEKLREWMSFFSKVNESSEKLKNQYWIDRMRLIASAGLYRTLRDKTIDR
jgi:hypothetical protein